MSTKTNGTFKKKFRNANDATESSPFFFCREEASTETSPQEEKTSQTK
ncbi:hypothetical protein OAV88_02835 [bacterium]|nr:hypothetical protein [bacterium]